MFRAGNCPRGVTHCPLDAVWIHPQSKIVLSFSGGFLQPDQHALWDHHRVLYRAQLPCDVCRTKVISVNSICGCGSIVVQVLLSGIALVMPVSGGMETNFNIISDSVFMY